MVLTWLFWGCIKAAPPLAVGDDRALAVVVLLDRAGADPTEDGPPRLDAAVLETVAARKLTPQLLEHGELLATLTGARDTALREAQLRAESPEGPILLVETRPAYYAEMNGQYRWVVGVTVTLFPTEGRPVLSDKFEVPVFLRYHHEREAEAADAAAGVVARHAGEVVDNWLRSGG